MGTPRAHAIRVQYYVTHILLICITVYLQNTYRTSSHDATYVYARHSRIEELIRKHISSTCTRGRAKESNEKRNCKRTCLPRLCEFLSTSRCIRKSNPRGAARRGAITYNVSRVSRSDEFWLIKERERERERERENCERMNKFFSLLLSAVRIYRDTY